MEDFTLLKSQKNQIFELIVNSGLLPADFFWSEVNSRYSETLNKISIIFYKNRIFYHRFEFWSDKPRSIYSPANFKREEIEYPGSWISQIDCVVNWLRYLKREINEPDLWEMVAKGSSIQETASNDKLENSIFTDPEKQLIIKTLPEIKHYLAHNFNLTRQHEAQVDARLDYLLEASERLGRKDWLNIFYSVMVGFVAQQIIPTSAAQEVFQFVGRLFGDLFDSVLALI